MARCRPFRLSREVGHACYQCFIASRIQHLPSISRHGWTNNFVIFWSRKQRRWMDGAARAPFTMGGSVATGPPGGVKGLCQEFRGSRIACCVHHCLADDRMWTDALAAGAVVCFCSSDLSGPVGIRALCSASWGHSSSGLERVGAPPLRSAISYKAGAVRSGFPVFAAELQFDPVGAPRPATADNARAKQQDAARVPRS